VSTNSRSGCRKLVALETVPGGGGIREKSANSFFKDFRQRTHTALKLSLPGRIRSEEMVITALQEED
jgi:hypothetical protein